MAADISRSRNRRTKAKEKASAARGMRRQRPRPVLAFAVGFLMWLTAVIMLVGVRPLYNADLTVGQRVPATIVAATDFESVDLARTELNRRRSADEAPPVFAIDNEEYRQFIRELGKIVDRLIQLRDTAAGDRAMMESFLRDTVDLLDVQLDPKKIPELFPPGREEDVLAAIEQAVTNVLYRGIRSGAEEGALLERMEDSAPLYIWRDASETLDPARKSDLLTVEEALGVILDTLENAAPGAENRAALSRLLRPWLTCNLRYEPVRTEARRQEAIQESEPVVMKVRTGETIARIGETVTPQVIEKLAAHDLRMRRLETPADRLQKLIGNAMLLIVALFICGAILFISRSRTLDNRPFLWVMLLLSVLVLLLSRGLFHVSVVTRWLTPQMLGAILPLSIGSILAAVLINPPAAVALGLWLSMASAVMHGNRFSVLMMGMAVTVVAVLTARDVQKRSSLFRVGFWVGMTKMFFMVGIGIIHQQAWNTIAVQGAVGLVSGMVYALIALLLIPLFESLFGLTTDIRLLELSDMGHPLLRRMAIEAPGTYHHSLMMANLAQAAASEIGANALLVRVCAYFHDIGKLTKPDFFTENIQQQSDPHETLSPSMSTLVILSHVKEGVSMALRHKLPRPVIDAIQQHHGTGLVSYFYHRARNRKADEANAENGNGHVREEDFRYGGPRPRSKEMAILALADSVEAASRSVEKPTPNKIEALVNDIIDAKQRDGQLDDTELTFRELTAIKRSFAFTMTNMLHGRIAYPQDENNDQQSAEENENTGGAAQEADRRDAS